MWKWNYIIIVYFVIINIISVIITVADKSQAKKHKRRISEKSLMILSVLGGGIGMYATMRVIRHKTHHDKFMIGIPLIISIELVLICVLVYLFH